MVGSDYEGNSDGNGADKGSRATYVNNYQVNVLDIEVAGVRVGVVSVKTKYMYVIRFGW